MLLATTSFAWSNVPPCIDDFVTLTAPVNGSTYVLDKDMPDEVVTFSWTDTGAAFYELVFSKSPDFSNPISVKNIDSPSKTFTYSQLQEILFDNAPTNGLNKYNNNVLYWNVKVGGMTVGTEPKIFCMEGMKIFKDIRGVETITYDVTVIPYADGTEGIWLSQNLRATKDIYGTDLPAKIYSDTGDGSEIMKANTQYPQPLKAIAGNYYRQSEIVQLKEKLVPEGWKYPTWNDYFNLYKAAKKQMYYLKSLYHPDGFPFSKDENYNAWNMNMATFGRENYNWKLSDCKIEERFYFMSYSYDTTAPDNPAPPNKPEGSVNPIWSRLNYVFSFQPSGTQCTEVSTGAVPVRLIYVGDAVTPDLQPERVPIAYKTIDVNNYTGNTYYVDSKDGDDGDDGKSENAAWKTLDKVNSKTFAPGDIVRFRCDRLWRGKLAPKGNGTSDSTRIVFTSYGSGEKPIIQNSVAKDNPSDWTETSAGSGVWKTYTGRKDSIDVGNIIFNHGQICAIKDSLLLPADSLLHFYKDTLSSTVYLNCDQNPADKFSSIELAIGDECVDYSLRKYVTFDGLTIRYAGRSGFDGHNTDNIIVRRCDIYMIGGAFSPIKFSGRTTRYGNGIQFWIRAENNLVENNRIWDIYDAALTNQGSGPDSINFGQRNIIFRNNIIWNSEYSFEIWNSPERAIMEDIIFENNTCVNAGKGWAHFQRFDGVNGNHLLSYTNSAKTKNVFIRNNIFYGSTEQCIRMDYDWKSFLTLDDNLYYTNRNGRIMLWLKENSYFSLKKYQQDMGLDTNSIFADPLFVDPENNDYRLSTSSPESILKMGVQEW